MMPGKKNKGGRPTKRTEAVVRKLEGVFAIGCTVTEAALFAGISRQSLYEWMRSDEEFSDRMTMLRARPFLVARKVIIQAIRDGNLRICKWYLERALPKEFSLRSKVDQVNKDEQPRQLVEFVNS